MTDQNSSLETTSNKTRAAVSVLLLDLCLLVVFFIEFFPKAFLAQASVITGMVGAVLTLLGMRWGEGSLAFRLAEQRTFVLLLRVLVITTALLLLGVIRPFEIRAIPGWQFI